MVIRMAVADSNGEYRERLLRRLEKYDELNLSVYTNGQNLEDAMRTKRFDVLLFDPSLYTGQAELGKSTLGVLLYDETNGVPEDCAKFPKIAKYQRISSIYKKVLELYADVCGTVDLASGSKRTRILAFYSPAGGSGKTTVSLAVATKLAMLGHKTFYINLEDIASEGCYLPQTGKKGMSELLGCLGTDTNFSVKLQGLLQSKIDHFYYVNHFATPNDMCEMKAEEVEELLEAFDSTGLFDFIIIDMGISLGAETVKVFDCADRIVLLEKPDATALCKLECFLSQIHIINEYAGKMMRVLNFGVGRASALQTNIPLVETIDMVQSPDSAQLIAVLANSGVNRLADALANQHEKTDTA